MSRVTLTDIGVNLLHGQFDADRDEVIARADSGGVSRMLITCTDLDESRRGTEFSRERDHDRYGCTAGIHPHHAKDAEPGWQERLRELVTGRSVRAVGETGLDFNRNFSPPDKQMEVFRAQLAIAADLGKPVFVHDRDSDGKVYDALREFAPHLAGVVVHCFTGIRKDLEHYLEAGFHVGITGWVCDERRGAELRRLVPLIPLDRLLIETDAPFLMPHNVPAGALPTSDRKRNEPCLLGYVLRKVAELCGRDADQIGNATHRNAARLFGWPTPDP